MGMGYNIHLCNKMMMMTMRMEATSIPISINSHWRL